MRARFFGLDSSTTRTRTMCDRRIPRARLIALRVRGCGVLDASLIVVSRSLVDEIQRRREVALPLETGGFLLGARRGRHLEITEATFQGLGDIAKRTSFERLSGQHQRDASRAWSEGNGLVGLIGDWHSHPTGDAKPSETDRWAWAALTKSIRSTGIGLIAATGGISLFGIAQSRWRLTVSRAVLIESDQNDLVYALESSASGSKNA